MWKLSNTGVIVLISGLSGCVLCTTLLGAIGVVLSLIILGYVCVSLVIDDSIVTRHWNYLVHSWADISKFLEQFYCQTWEHVSQLFQVIKIWYNQLISNRMERFRRGTYQLSSDSLVNSPRSSAEAKGIGGLSPIPKRSNNPRISQSENNIYGRGSGAYENARAFDKVTSTPMTPWRHRETDNGDVSPNSVMTHRGGKKGAVERPRGSQGSRNTSSEERLYSQNGSPWGTSISPKIRPRAAGVKTVQTVAGPLLASTRYNIDTKTYTDVTSPGLTSRLTKYATEATTKLIHQSQYGTGQFPRVNLNSSPTPLINSKTGKMRLPVTVRIAPPDPRQSPPDRQRLMSDICQKEIPKTPPTVAQVLRDISLKRHASREDIAAELIKKQRTDGLYSDDLENLEEMTQKRARDDSSRSDEDISIDNPSSRPVKRTKKPSCYDILNSLSSSTNVSSGIKRKADISRCGTPDIGKHFKSLDTKALDSSPGAKSTGDVQKLNKSSDKNTPIETSPKKSVTVSPKSSIRSIMKQASPEAAKIEEIFKDAKNSMPEVTQIKLTDRLFMREEPQNLDKLKNLIDEHSSTSKFSKCDSEEIKKSDIVNMRQTSMKAKLKSMFDAISGKTASTIDPSVVIQAEPISPVEPTSPSLATLSSTTSTTNVNTSPISTSAVIPIIGKSKVQGTPGKHVTFNLPVSSGDNEGKVEVKKADSSFGFGGNASSGGEKTQSLGFSTSETPSASLFGSQPSQPTQTTPASVSNPVTSVANPSAVSDKPETGNTEKPGFSFGASSAPVPSISSVSVVSSTPSASSTSTLPTFSQSTQKLSFQPVSTPTPSLSSTSGLFDTPKPTLFNTPSSTVAPTDPPSFAGTNKSADPPNLTGFKFGGASATSSAPATAPVAPVAAFSFGGAPVAPVAPTVAPPAASTGFSFGKTASTPGFSFGSSAASTVPQPAATNLTFTTASPAPAFGSSTSAPAFGTPTATASTPAFGTSVTPGFGTPSATASAPAFGTVPQVQSLASAPPAFASSTYSSPAFGTPSTSSVPTFGTPSATSSAPAFGTPATSAAFGTPATSAPVFGTPATPAPAFGTPATSAPAFGTPSATSSAPAFGTPSTSAPAFGTPSTSSTPAFGTPSTSATPAFGTQSSAFSASSSLFNPTGQPAIPATTSALSFGGVPKTAPPAFGTTTASATSLFNGATPATSAAPSGSMFSGASAFGRAKAPPAFGATTAGTSSFAGSSLFGGQPTTTAGFGVNPTTTSSFGTAGAAPGFGAAGGTPGFGGATGAPPAFGAAGTPAPAFGAPGAAPPAFGATGATGASFGNSGAAPPAFGATGTTTPAFGATGTTTPAFGGNSSGFGAQNGSTSGFSGVPPSFGATTTAPPAFPTGTSSTSGFGTPATAPPAFGSTTSSFSGFGGSTTAVSAAPTFARQQPAAPGFASSATAPPAFGATNGTSGGSFAFGGNPTAPATTQGQQGNMFAFGGNSNPGFQFGGSTTTPQTGFNFSGSAPSSTPAVPTFSAPSPSFGGSSGGNMFSIGSGSVAPRSRSTRSVRRQR